MNKSELIAAIAAESGLSKTDAGKALGAIAKQRMDAKNKPGLLS